MQTTPKQEQILAFYTNILKSVNVSESDTGLLQNQIQADQEPRLAYVEKKTIRLPTRENLGSPDENILTFHPLSEVNNKGESIIFQQLKDWMIYKINTCIIKIMNLVITYGSNKEVSLKLSAKKLKVISDIIGDENVKKDLIGRFQKMIIAAAQRPDSRLLTIYIKQSARPYGTTDTFTRAAAVNFPLVTELRKSDADAFGIKFAKYERRIINKLFEVVLPNSVEIDAYSIYDNPTYAPSLTVLLKAYKGIATKVNRVLSAFDDELDELEQLNLDWVDDIDKIPQWVNVIPPQRGNEGVVTDKVGNKVEEVRPTSNQPKVDYRDRTLANPEVKRAEVVVPPPVSSSTPSTWSGDGSDMSELIRSRLRETNTRRRRRDYDDYDDRDRGRSSSRRRDYDDYDDYEYSTGRGRGRRDYRDDRYDDDRRPINNRLGRTGRSGSSRRDTRDDSRGRDRDRGRRGRLIDRV